LSSAYEQGITFFDTAEAYGNLVLSTDELKRINTALETIRISGERYPAYLMARVGK
jgi:aryl-alcohol dehydrogenase-like predicted oxidoreductase